MKIKTHELVTGALLSALSLMIPILFGPSLSIPIPPFSATLCAHVPTMLAFLISPFTAVMVGLVSAFGFLLTKGPVIAARAIIHAVFGFAGAVMVKKGMSFKRALILTAPIHALGEALIVIPFGFTLYKGFFIVGVGTLIHHSMDALIALAVAKALIKANKLIKTESAV